MFMECEWLQGMFDDYMLILYCGKFVVDVLCYKVIGNFMVVLCMVWLGNWLVQCLYKMDLIVLD